MITINELKRQISTLKQTFKDEYYSDVDFDFGKKLGAHANRLNNLDPDEQQELQAELNEIKNDLNRIDTYIKNKTPDERAAAKQAQIERKNTAEAAKLQAPPSTIQQPIKRVASATAATPAAKTKKSKDAVEPKDKKNVDEFGFEVNVEEELRAPAERVSISDIEKAMAGKVTRQVELSERKPLAKLSEDNPVAKMMAARAGKVTRQVKQSERKPLAKLSEDNPVAKMMAARAAQISKDEPTPPAVPTSAASVTPEPITPPIAEADMSISPLPPVPPAPPPPGAPFTKTAGEAVPSPPPQEETTPIPQAPAAAPPPPGAPFTKTAGEAAPSPSPQEEAPPIPQAPAAPPPPVHFPVESKIATTPKAEPEAPSPIPQAPEAPPPPPVVTPLEKRPSVEVSPPSAAQQAQAEVAPPTPSKPETREKPESPDEAKQEAARRATAEDVAIKKAVTENPLDVPSTETPASVIPAKRLSVKTPSPPNKPLPEIPTATQAQEEPQKKGFFRRLWDRLTEFFAKRFGTKSPEAEMRQAALKSSSEVPQKSSEAEEKKTHIEIESRRPLITHEFGQESKREEKKEDEIKPRGPRIS